MKKPNLNKEQFINLIRIVISLILFIAVFTVDKIIDLATVINTSNGWILPFLLYLIIYILIGYDVLYRALRNIFHGQIFDENFLMCIATLGAFGLAIYGGVSGKGTEGFDEACAVLLFYQIGEFFQDYATDKSRKSISSLMNIRPDYANLMKDGKIEKVEPTEVKEGDIVLVYPGEKIPLDGVIVKGNSVLDTKDLTGESLPKDVFEGDEVISGYINMTSQIEVEVKKEFYNSTVNKILNLVENASAKKAKAENFITKFAKYYTPVVVFVALALAVVPSLITGEWSVWVYRALSFLVVSCPCALVISIPLSFFAGIGAASGYGILVKGSNYLEKLNKAKIFVFDKTGTLTKGNFKVSQVCPENRREEILKFASIAEKNSNHPIAKSIIGSYGKKTDNNYSVTEISGLGICATDGKSVIYCGNEKLMKEKNINYTEHKGAGTVVYVAKDNDFIGSVLISDELKSETKDVISEIKNMGCKSIMLTGDNENVAKKVALQIGIDEYKSSLLPDNKVEELEKIIANKDKEDVVCFVGDGINDAPVLMRSDIGIAMGGVGSDAAIEAADIVLMNDNLKGISVAKKIARKTMKIVFENIWFSITVKVAILILSAIGLANMWVAVFGDVGVAFIAILNAMRVNSKFKKIKKEKEKPKEGIIN